MAKYYLRKHKREAKVIEDREWEEDMTRPWGKTIQLILVELNEDILARTQVF